MNAIGYLAIVMILTIVGIVVYEITPTQSGPNLVVQGMVIRLGAYETVHSQDLTFNYTAPWGYGEHSGWGDIYPGFQGYTIGEAACILFNSQSHWWLGWRIGKCDPSNRPIEGDTGFG